MSDSEVFEAKKVREERLNVDGLPPSMKQQLNEDVKLLSDEMEQRKRKSTDR